MNTSNQNTNPLMSVSSLKNEAVPFNKVSPEHYLPAVSWAIDLARKNIDKIKSNSEPATFENTILALESSAEDLDSVATVFYNQLGANTNDEMQTLAQKIGPELSNYSSDILLDEKLFARVKQVYDSRQSFDLDQEQKQLLENTYLDFARNGALVSDQAKQQLRQIDQELSKVGPQYSENILKATNKFELVINDEGDLSGLPDSAKEAAAMAAKDKGKGGSWVFNLQHPSYVPFMQFSDKRELREKMWFAFCSRAFQDDFDNQENVLKIVKLRHQRAQLLGYKTHADFVLEKRMAGNPEKVNAFVSRLLEASKPAAIKDLAEIQKLADELGGPSPIQPWDFPYYAEKLKQKNFEFNDEDLRPYFQLENVVDGLFEHARRLYGIVFKSTSEYPVYHEDVKVYEVYTEKTNDFVGLFYADFFPRESKNSGAWMTSYRQQGMHRGEIKRPHISIVCNFTKPTTDKPSLLTFQEVRTLFHECGHALHGLLSQCKYQSLGGTNVYWDFVELPSQIFENWILEKESLDIFAKHYKTGELIPDELANKIKQSSRFLAGYYSLRQVTFSSIDMKWHSQSPDSIASVSDFEEQAIQDSALFPYIDGTNFSVAFSHIFAGGYSAGYYSYKWAEVLDADAFEMFQEHGLFDSNVAQRFKENILEKGGSRHPMELYKAFRGREPDPDALLRRDGLIP